ncbi:MAG: superoxide dismutase [Ni] [Planctomycetota bacterium]|jgi:hypothetical protein
MKRLSWFVLAALFLALGTDRTASAHCEVPCGIYDDGARFTSMHEDAKTIAKAMGQISELAEEHDPLAANQLVRWVNTKEAHATHVMETIGQYFMAQRIKPATDEAGAARYVNLLTGAHAVMRAAMKCKQTVDTDNATALITAIQAFRATYEQ